MRTFYSILYTPIRPVIKEQVSVGLMLINESDIIFKYSLDKITFLNKLIPHEAVSFLKTYLKNIDNSVKKFYKDKISEQLLPIKPSDSRIFQYDYYNYLNKYSNNLITFSKPIDIDIELNQSNFNILYEKYIDYLSSSDVEVKPSKTEIAKKRLYPKIENNVNLDIEIDRIDLPALESPKSVFPNMINILGKNGHYLSGQFIDFEKRIDHLKADLSFYLHFVNEIDNEGNHFLIGDEPNKKSIKNHFLWDDFRNFQTVKYVPNSEVELIEKYIIEKKVKRIFELDN